MTLEHQRLIDFLEEEAAKRNQNLGELAEAMGINPSQLYNLRGGKQPGLKLCRDIARFTHQRLDYILLLAGQITEDELSDQDDIPPELIPTIRKIARLRGTPFFDLALDILETAADRILEMFKLAA